MGRLADRFGLVLIACIATYTIILTLDTTRWFGLVASVAVLVTVRLSIRASTPPWWVGMTATVLVLVGIAFGGVDAADQTTEVLGTSMLLTSLALALCVIAMVVRMLEHTYVDARTVLAAVASYVMLGLVFAFLDSAIGLLTGHFFAQKGAHPGSDYAYLSYITLTTVGFGDLTPGTSIARSSIILEALMGQIFLVTLVARMVSLYGTQSRPRRPTEAKSDPEAPE